MSASPYRPRPVESRAQRADLGRIRSVYQYFTGGSRGSTGRGYAGPDIRRRAEHRAPKPVTAVLFAESCLADSCDAWRAMSTLRNRGPATTAPRTPTTAVREPPRHPPRTPATAVRDTAATPTAPHPRRAPSQPTERFTGAPHRCAAAPGPEIDQHKRGRASPRCARVPASPPRASTERRAASAGDPITAPGPPPDPRHPDGSVR